MQIHAQANETWQTLRAAFAISQKSATERRVDFAAQRRAIWKGRKFSVAEVAAMRAAELEGEQ